MKKYLIIITVIIIIVLPKFYTLPIKKYHHPVEKIYVINLDKNPERLEKISQSLREQGLSFTRFKAIYGMDLKMKDPDGKIFTGADLKSGKVVMQVGETYKILCPNVTLNYKFDPDVYDFPLTAGEFGVYCSHVEIMNEVLHKRYKSVLVLEDDASIPKNLAQELHKIEKSMPNYKKMDIIHFYLEAVKNVKSIPFNELNKLNDKSSGLGYIHAYIYGFKGAGSMIKALKHINSPIDIELFRCKLNSFSTKNITIGQNNYKSEITNQGRNVL